jgi:hypothetical protein
MKYRYAPFPLGRADLRAVTHRLAEILDVGAVDTEPALRGLSLDVHLRAGKAGDRAGSARFRRIRRCETPGPVVRAHRV